MEILLWIIVITLINGLLAFAGALVFYIFKHKIDKSLIYFVAFTTGALLGGAFFHFIPESLNELKLVKTTIIVIIGFVSFLLVERLLHWHHCHEGKCDKHPFSYLLIYGDAIHNFIDGLIIAGSFLVSVPIGIITSILILAHELPQEIGDFGTLIYGGLDKRKALLYNFLSQITSVIGGILGFYILGIENYAIYLLPFAAGGFLYIAIGDLIPEIFKEKKLIKVISNLTFIILGILILISTKLIIG